MAPCVTPLPRVSSATLISSELTTRSNTARRVGSASERRTALMAAAWVIADTLAATYHLVKTNHYFRLRPPSWSRRGANQSCAIKRRGFVIRLVGYDLRDREGWWRARDSRGQSQRAAAALRRSGSNIIALG